jgi:hypothetical protein
MDPCLKSRWSRWCRAAMALGSVALVGYLLAQAGCGPDPEAYNCGLYDTYGWKAPDGCICTDPDGRTTWMGPDGKEQSIHCEDTRLLACPSSSGAGCGLIGMPQEPLENVPAEVLMHVDIGGHLHDLCCAQHYYAEGGRSSQTSCNGCTALSPEGVSTCVQTSVGGAADLVFGKPFDPRFPCAVEWKYATIPFDTSLRWTPAQAIVRNMAGTPGEYVRPDGKGGRGPPLYGRALAPTDDDPVDRRGPPATILGDQRLGQPYVPDGDTLGLSEAQIGSFCQSERAHLVVEALWVCE